MTTEQSHPVKPIEDLVLIQVDEDPTHTPGGIMVTERAMSEPYATGTVLAVGPGYTMFNGVLAPTEVQTGDRVIFPRHSIAHEYKEDPLQVLINERHIYGIIEDEEN